MCPHDGMNQTIFSEAACLLFMKLISFSFTGNQANKFDRYHEFWQEKCVVLIQKYSVHIEFFVDRFMICNLS